MWFVSGVAPIAPVLTRRTRSVKIDTSLGTSPEPSGFRDLTAFPRSRPRTSREPELSQHRGLIPLLPSFHHQPVAEAVHDQSVKRHAAARWWSAAKRAGVGAGRMPSERDVVPGPHLILDRQPQVAKGGQEAGHNLRPRIDAAQ